MSIGVQDVMNHIKKSNFPNMYPEQKFLKEHYKITKEYADYIQLYKMNCYIDINNYYRSGEIPETSNKCYGKPFENVKAKMGKPDATYPEIVKFIIVKLEELHKKVKPIPHDIIAYRGITQGIIGQNMFNGKCIKTRAYGLEEHFLCEADEMEDIKLFSKYDENHGNPLSYIYEGVGFTSVSTKISIALNFARSVKGSDTLLMMRIPAGTKFIMPIKQILDNYFEDPEFELILFPFENTFLVYDVGYTNMYDFTNEKIRIPIYGGSLCNELNVYRKQEFKRKPRFKSDPDWSMNLSINRPILGQINNLGKCQVFCDNYQHFCEPDSKKCIADKPENIEKLKNWWRNKIVSEEKCSKEIIDKCIDEYKFCNPKDGTCTNVMPIELLEKVDPEKAKMMRKLK